MALWAQLSRWYLHRHQLDAGRRLLILCVCLGCVTAQAVEVNLWRDDPTRKLPQDAPDFRISSVLTDRVAANTTASRIVELEQQGWRITRISQQESISRAAYWTHAQIDQMIQQWAIDYPSRCSTYLLDSDSVQGRPLRVLRISDNPNSHDPEEPRIKLVGAIHGDEKSSTAMLVFLVEHLLEKDGTVSGITRLLDEIDLHILLVMNPDGWEANTRGNANGTDLNRNFPSPFAAVTVRQETQAVMDWTHDRQFLLSAGLHSGAVAIVYPWGHLHTPQNPAQQFPETMLAKSICDQFAANNPYIRENLNAPANPNGWVGVINGDDWYPINNEMADWNYRYAGCLETTIEISGPTTNKAPPFDSVDQYFLSDDRTRNNQHGLLTYLAQGLNCVRGRIMDAQTNTPIAAKISIQKPISDCDRWMLLPPLQPGWNPVGLPRQPVNTSFSFGAGTMAWAFDPQQQIYTQPTYVAAGRAYMVHSENAIAAQLVAVHETVKTWESSTRWRFVSLLEDAELGANRGFRYTRQRARIRRLDATTHHPAGRALWTRSPAADTPAPVVENWPVSENLPYPMLNAPATNQQIDVTTDSRATGWFHRLLGPRSMPLWIEGPTPSLSHSPPTTTENDMWSIAATFNPPMTPAAVFIPDGEAFNQQGIPIPRTADIPLNPKAVTCRAIWQHTGQTDPNSWYVNAMIIQDRNATVTLPPAPAGESLRYRVELIGENANELAAHPSTGYTLLQTP